MKNLSDVWLVVWSLRFEVYILLVWANQTEDELRVLEDTELFLLKQSTIFNSIHSGIDSIIATMVETQHVPA